MITGQILGLSQEDLKELDRLFDKSDSGCFTIVTLFIVEKVADQTVVSCEQGPVIKVQTLIDKAAKFKVVIRAECLAVLTAQIGANGVTFPDCKITVHQRWDAVLGIDPEELRCQMFAGKGVGRTVYIFKSIC